MQLVARPASSSSRIAERLPSGRDRPPWPVNSPRPPILQTSRLSSNPYLGNTRQSQREAGWWKSRAAVQGCRGALQQYQGLLDTIFDVVVVHRHGKIIKVNPAADARGVHEARGDDWNAGRRILSLSPLPLARCQPWDWMPVSDVTPMTSRRPTGVHPSGCSGDGKLRFRNSRASSLRRCSADNCRSKWCMCRLANSRTRSRESASHGSISCRLTR